MCVSGVALQGIGGNTRGLRLKHRSMEQRVKLIDRL